MTEKELGERLAFVKSNSRLIDSIVHQDYKTGEVLFKEVKNERS
jgi:hypothetical protein